MNGSVEPRLVLRELYPAGDPDREGEDGAPSLLTPAAATAPSGGSASRLSSPPTSRPGREMPAKPAEDLERRRVVERTGSPASVLAELVSSGEGVLALCADACRRAELALGAAGLARFGGGAGVVACGRCVDGPLERAAGERGLVLADCDALGPGTGFRRRLLPRRRRRPAAFPHLDEAILGARDGGLPASGLGGRRTALCVRGRSASSSTCAPTWRGPTGPARRPASGAELLRRPPGRRRPPPQPGAGRPLPARARRARTPRRQPSAGAGVRGRGRILGDDRAERSLAFRACRTRHEEARRYLESHSTALKSDGPAAEPGADPAASEESPDSNGGGKAARRRPRGSPRPHRSAPNRTTHPPPRSTISPAA